LLGTQTTRKSLATEEGLERLAGLMKEAIEKEIRDSLRITKDLKADVYGFGEQFHDHYHKDWLRMKANWDEVFPSIRVELDIKTKVVTAGAILEPIYPTGKY
jgi:spore germination protein KC